MFFHASLPADDPERVARVIAELWGGEAMPFPPYPGGWMAWADDGRGTEIEVMPRGQEQVPAPVEVEVRRNPSPPTYSECHFALGTRCTAAEALAIAAREGWTARMCDRGGFFSVVELWVENRFLLELLPDEEQRRYRQNMTPARFSAAFGLARG